MSQPSPLHANFFLQLLDHCHNLVNELRDMCSEIFKILDDNWNKGFNFSQKVEDKELISAKLRNILKVILPTPPKCPNVWFEKSLFVDKLELTILSTFSLDLHCTELLEMLGVDVKFDGPTISKLTEKIYPRILKNESDEVKHTAYTKLYLQAQKHDLGNFVNTIFIPGIPRNHMPRKTRMVFQGDNELLKNKGYVALESFYPELEVFFVHQVKIAPSLAYKEDLAASMNKRKRKKDEFKFVHIENTFRKKRARLEEDNQAISNRTLDTELPRNGKSNISNWIGMSAEIFVFEMLSNWIQTRSGGRRTFHPAYWVSSGRSAIFPEMADSVDDTLGYDMYFDDDDGLIPITGNVGEQKEANRSQKVTWMFEIKGHWSERGSFKLSRNQWEMAMRSSSRFTAEYHYVVIGVVLFPEPKMLYWLKDPFALHSQSMLNYNPKTGRITEFAAGHSE